MPGILTAQNLATLAADESALRALSGEAHAIALAGFFAGILLWLLGRRMLRPLFVVLGASLGAMAGTLILPLTDLPTVQGFPPALVGLVAGALVGLVLAVALFKAVVALSAGVAFAVAGLVGGLVYLQHFPTDPPPDGETSISLGERIERAVERAATDELASRADRAAASLNSAARRGVRKAADAGEPGEAIMDAIGEVPWHSAAERSRVFFERFSRRASGLWDSWPVRDRVVILASVAGGLVFGLLFGLGMPGRSTVLITALLGSAVWLACGAWLAEVTTLPGREVMQQPPKTWAMIWLGVAISGMAFQFSRFGRPRSRAGSPGPN